MWLLISRPALALAPVHSSSNPRNMVLFQLGETSSDTEDQLLIAKKYTEFVLLSRSVEIDALSGYRLSYGWKVVGNGRQLKNLHN